MQRPFSSQRSRAGSAVSASAEWLTQSFAPGVAGPPSSVSTSSNAVGLHAQGGSSSNSGAANPYLVGVSEESPRETSAIGQAAPITVTAANSSTSALSAGLSQASLSMQRVLHKARSHSIIRGSSQSGHPRTPLSQHHGSSAQQHTPSPMATSGNAISGIHFADSPSFSLADSSASLSLHGSFGAANNAGASSPLSPRGHTAGSLSSSSHPPSPVLPGHNGGGGGDALDSAIVWSEITHRVTPLFNGEGLRGHMDQLNTLVEQYLKLQPSVHLAVDSLCELLRHCLGPFEAKLSGVSDETKLVSRLVEIWTFLFGNVLTYFQGVFLPLQSAIDRVVDQASAPVPLIYAENRENVNTSNSTLQPPEVPPKPTLPDGDARLAVHYAASDSIRRIVLLAFRNQIVFPLTEKIKDAFGRFFVPLDPNGPSDMTNYSDSLPRMLQMFCILGSLRTGDEPQRAVDVVLAGLKAKGRRRESIDF